MVRSSPLELWGPHFRFMFSFFVYFSFYILWGPHFRVILGNSGRLERTIVPSSPVDDDCTMVRSSRPELQSIDYLDHKMLVHPIAQLSGVSFSPQNTNFRTVKLATSWQILQEPRTHQDFFSPRLSFCLVEFFYGRKNPLL